MIINILPFRLHLASLEKKDIPRCTHQLMKLILFPTGSRYFFSYTETDKEVSLILDKSHLDGFPKGALNTYNVVWRAVQIEPGESGLGAEDVISQVSRPLAESNISIMQISTYDADFTLIPEYDLERALECLSNVFTISNNPLEDLGLQPSDLESWRTSYPLNPGGDVKSIQDTLLLETDVSDKLNISSLSSNQSVNHTTLNHGLKSIKARHPFNANYSCRLHITSMEQSLMGMLAIRLLESIFFDSRMERFFSFTQTDTTMSIIMDDATMSLFPEHTLNTHAGDWRLIAIGDGPLGFDECGVVSEYSRPLSENGIGLFYMSTFRSDYIMVNDHDFERAVSHLHKIAKEISPPVMDSQQDEEEGEENNQAMMTHFSSDSDSVSVSDSDSSSDADSASEVDPDEHDMNAKHGYDHDDDLEIVFVDESIPT